MNIVRKDRCKHEIDPASEKYHKKGRVGVCKHCGCKMYRTIFINNPRRETPHMSKKKRLKIRREKSEKGKGKNKQE